MTAVDHQIDCLYMMNRIRNSVKMSHGGRTFTYHDGRENCEARGEVLAPFFPGLSQVHLFSVGTLVL